MRAERRTAATRARIAAATASRTARKVNGGA
jgi:hypothetical protein